MRQGNTCIRRQTTQTKSPQSGVTDLIQWTCVMRQAGTDVACARGTVGVSKAGEGMPQLDKPLMRLQTRRLRVESGKWEVAPCSTA